MKKRVFLLKVRRLVRKAKNATMLYLLEKLSRAVYDFREGSLARLNDVLDERLEKYWRDDRQPDEIDRVVEFDDLVRNPSQLEIEFG